MGAARYTKTAYDMMQLSTPCFRCHPPPFMDLEALSLRARPADEPAPSGLSGWGVALVRARARRGATGRDGARCEATRDPSPTPEGPH